MKNHPLVSVVVLTYNSSEFVVETLDSIKDQSYPNLELIISDDASKDDTVQVCKDWTEQNSDRFLNCQIISQEINQGIPANCNTGIKNTKGEFIKIIAGDDLLQKTCIQDNLDFSFQNTDRKIVISEMDAFLDGTEPKKILEHKIPFGNVFEGNSTSQEQYNLLVHSSYFGNAPTLFYDRTVFETVQFDESLPLLEDYPFAILATKKGFKYHYLKKNTVLYRVRENSAYFKGQAEIFGKFYKTKHEFDQKYRFPLLSRISLRNEMFHYKIHEFFDNQNLNKKTPFLQLLFKGATYANPYRYLLFIQKRVLKR